MCNRRAAVCAACAAAPADMDGSGCAKLRQKEKNACVARWHEQARVLSVWQVLVNDEQDTVRHANNETWVK